MLGAGVFSYAAHLTTAARAALQGGRNLDRISTVTRAADNAALPATTITGRASGRIDDAVPNSGAGGARLIAGNVKDLISRFIKDESGSVKIPFARQNAGNGVNSALSKADFPEINSRVSTQKQQRHLENGIDPRTGQPPTGSVMKSEADAQTVIDTFNSGNATVVGQTPQGFPIVRVDNVTGTYRNELNTGRVISEPSNVFVIKGASSPSIYPANPQNY